MDQEEGHEGPGRAMPAGVIPLHTAGGRRDIKGTTYMTPDEGSTPMNHDSSQETVMIYPDFDCMDDVSVPLSQGCL